MNLSTCKDCHQEIRWIITPKGKRMALDPQPCAIGNVVIDRLDDKNQEYGHVLKKDEDPVALRYVPHVATCPERAKK